MQRVTPAPWQLEADASKSVEKIACSVEGCDDAGSAPCARPVPDRVNAGRQSDIAETALHDCPALLAKHSLGVNPKIKRGGKLQFRLAQVHAYSRPSQAS